MNRLLLLLILVGIGQAVSAQYVYTIKADSVKITNSCDTAELILENHTQTVPGFLFNKGRGRTEFRRVLNKISDTLVTIGSDTLRMPYAWIQGGNRWNTTGVFGTLDNNHVDFYSNGIQRARLLNNGNWQIGYNELDNGDKLQIGNIGAVTINANLSRSADRIQIGGAINFDDGQNVLMRVSSDNGFHYRNILVERDGYLGIGNTDRGCCWAVGNPAIRIYPNGVVNFYSTYGINLGIAGGPLNASQLATYVNNPDDEWNFGAGITHSKNNYYFLGTKLGGAENGNVRANLRLSARELHFYSGPGDGLEGVEAARFTEAGNLLIGSDQDYGQKLQVNGKAKIVDSLTVWGNILQGYKEVATLGNGLRFDINNNRARIYIEGGISYVASAAGDQHVFTNYIGAQHTGTVMVVDPGPYPEMPETQSAFKVNGQVQPFVVTVKGRTGIGTLTPSAQLHTTGTVRFAGLTTDNTQRRVLVADDNGNLYTRDASSLTAINGIMNSDLAVNGAVSAQKMLIAQTGRWPDYVFSKQYHLPSLTEVENFINQNNHLPGIPSAAEVEKKGIDVANNQAALLKKIEELTLYVIEQEKQLQKQNEVISELKNQNNELSEKSKDLDLLKKQVAELMEIIKGK